MCMINELCIMWCKVFMLLEIYAPRCIIKPLTKIIIVAPPWIKLHLNLNKNKNKNKKTPNKTATKRQGCENIERSGAWGEVKGGWPLLAVMKDRVCITGSCLLYERDREGFTKKEETWKRDSQSEREAIQPLESTLRLTPLYSLPFSICKYSTSSEDSVIFDVILFIYHLGRRLERKIPLAYTGHTDRCLRGGSTA